MANGPTNSMIEERLIDRPIVDTQDDLLGFGKLTGAIANLIYEQPNSSNLILGLDGPWGSGKSSVLQLLQKELDFKLEEQSDTGVGLIVVPFSPWLITNRTALITAFFGQLVDAVDRATRRAVPWWNILKFRKRMKFTSLRKELHHFSALVAIGSTATSNFDPTLTSDVVAGSAKVIESVTGSNDPTLEQRKTDLILRLKDIALNDSTFRVLVLIDDMDRLDPEDTIEVLRLVKAVADFPAVTYLLAYDRNALADAIEKNRKGADGNAYMEKNLQFSFKIPPLEPFRLRQWLKLEIEGLTKDKVAIESMQAETVLDLWAGRLLKTPRDVKRLLFAVRAIWKDLESKVDLLDLIWLQMVKEKAGSSSANLYGWVIRYLQSLDAIALGGVVVGKKEDCNELAKILKELGWRVRDDVDEGSSIDFHYLNRLLAGVTQSYMFELADEKKRWSHEVSKDELQEFREAKRLSSPWHWRLYFAFETPSHAITDDEWTALTQAAEKSAEDLAHSILTLLERGMIGRPDLGDQLVDRIQHAAKQGNLDQPKNWIFAVVCSATNLRRHSKELPLFVTDTMFDRTVHTMIRHVFGVLDADERKEVVHFVFVESPNVSLAAELFRHQYAAKKAGGVDESEKLYLTDSELKCAADGQLKLYTALSAQDFIELSSPYDVLFAWREITESKDGPSTFLSKAFETDEGFLNSLSALKAVTSTQQNGVPHLPEGYLRPFVDTVALKSRLENLAISGGVNASQASDLLSLWWEARKSVELAESKK